MMVLGRMTGKLAEVRFVDGAVRLSVTLDSGREWRCEITSRGLIGDPGRAHFGRAHFAYVMGQREHLIRALGKRVEIDQRSESDFSLTVDGVRLT